MSQLRVFIVSNYSLFSHGLKSLLESINSLSIVGQANTIQEATQSIKQLNLDIVILDTFGISKSSKLEIFEILMISPQVKIIALNMQNDKILVYQATEQIAEDVKDLVEVIEQALPFSTENSQGISPQIES